MQEELIIGLVLLLIGCLPIAFGIGIGWLLFGGRSRRPIVDREDEVAATARTIRRLGREGAIDQELRHKLLELIGVFSIPPGNARQDDAVPFSQPSSDEAVIPEATPPTDVPEEVVPAQPFAQAVEPEDVVGEIYVAELVDDSQKLPPVHPLDAPEPELPVGPSIPQQRRRALADVLQAFMADKNIRWGELVSGILIVGCSIALVISLRREIESLSERFIYLPALLFMLATAAIHGAGNYTLRRWNLRATSRGVLIIATLLIPINFLAAIIVTGPESKQLPLFHPLYLSAVVVGLGAFGTMAYFAGQALMRDGVWRLWLGVMGTSCGQLIISRVAGDQTTAISANLLVAVPVIAYLVATGRQLQTAARWPRMGLALARETLLLLGVATFSLAAPIGLMLSRSDSIRLALTWLSTPLSFLAAVVLGTGLALHQRVLSRRLTVLRTTGTALALFGGVMMLAALVLAWPDPQLMITVGLFSFVSLSLLAATGRLPALHVPAIICGALASFLSFHLLQNSFAGYEAGLPKRIVDLFLMGRSCVALTVLAGVSCGAAIVLQRLGRRAAAVSYMVGSGGIAATSVVLAIVVGFWGTAGQEADLASPVLILYAVALLATSFVSPRGELTWTGTTLLLCGFVHAIGWNTAVRDAMASAFPPYPILIAVLAHGIVVAALAVAQTIQARFPSSQSSSPRWRQLILPLIFSAMASSVLSLGPAALVEEAAFANRALYLTALATIWLASAVVQRTWVNLSIFQSLATLALVFTTASICERQSWWSGRFFSSLHLQAQFGALAIWCLAWSVGRRLARRRWPGFVEGMRGGGHVVDEFVLAAALIGLLVTCFIACWPGVEIELGLTTSSRVADLSVWRSALGSGTWIAAAMLLAGVVGSLIERFSLAALSGLFLLAGVAALLTSGLAYDSTAVATGARWAFALLGAVLMIATVCGDRIAAIHRRWTWLEWGELPSNIERFSRSWTVGLIAAPVLGLTTASLLQAALGVSPNGPVAGSFFAGMGSELSFGVPLGLLVVVLVAFAARERNTRLMLSGSAVFQYLVNLAFFLPILRDPNAQFDSSVAIECLQWNSLGLSLYSLAWLGARRWIDAAGDRSDQGLVSEGSPGRLDSCLACQIVATVAVVALTTGLATVAVIASPHDLTPYSSLGGWLSYLVCLLGFGAAAWLTRQHLEHFGISLLLGFMLSIGGPLAVSLEGAPGAWRAFHILMLAWSSTAIAATALTWVAPRWKWNSEAVAIAIRWAAVLSVSTLLLAAQATFFDSASPWWSFAVALMMVCVAGALGFRTRSQVYAYASTIMSAAAVSMVWWGAWPNDALQGAIEFVQLNLIAVVVASMVWLGAEVWRQFGEDGRLDGSDGTRPVHRVVAIGASLVLLIVAMYGFCLTGLCGVARSDLNIANECGWVLLLLLGGLLVGSLWDQQMKYALPAMYAWGVAAVMMSLDGADGRFEFDQETVFVAASIAMAAYVALTGRLWRFGANLAAGGERLGMHDVVGRLQRASTWLPPVTLFITATVSSTGLIVVLNFTERWMRVGAAFAPLLLAYGVGCQAQMHRRAVMQRTALALASLSAVYAAWADIQPGWVDTLLLERAVRVLIVSAALAFLYAIPASRWARQRGDWFPIVRQMGAACGVAAIVALCVVLSLELAYFEPGVGVPFGHPYQVVAVAIVLVGLIAAFLALALARESESLSESKRMGFVYAAQLVGALLFAHLYLSHPQLFGMFKPYWPYIVLGIAFAGVGAGELFQRSGFRVLAEPFQRTGGFLPLLPALGWWLNGSLGIDAAGHYSLVLFFAGLVFVMLSMLRRSYFFGIAAAIAGNAALWANLGDFESLTILKHPQFWLIPPAVSALVAAHVNRRLLNESQLTTVRYVCLLLIYVSSTADVFIDGIGHSLWEPMVLAMLSVIGVFVGIGLQIRAFLYLGAAFVFLSVLSMVWHAYANVQHVGIWWGFGIVLGLLILVIFGVFEKKRPELLRVVEDMRAWEQ